MSESDHGGNPKVEAFHGDLVLDEGRVVGTVGPIKRRTPWGEVESAKAPNDEIVLDPETTLHVDLTDRGGA